MRRLLAPVLLAAALALAACGSDDGSAVKPDDLSGRAFAGVAVAGHANDVAIAVRPKAIAFTFDGDRVSVTTGCNTLAGTYALHGSIFRLPDPTSTMMGCEPAMQAQQDWLTGLLHNGMSLSLEGDRLTLTTHGTTLRMTERAQR